MRVGPMWCGGTEFHVLMTALLSFFHASSLELGARFSSHVGFHFKQLEFS